MKLSIVIVNYNVEYFLEQCLISVRKAVQDIDAEVFVVDNKSVDGSLRMLKEKFPEVKLIANKDNKGFSRANNQAIHKSVGEYVLLLNPDTVVEDDTFTKCIAFMDEHPDAGGLGVKMIDGTGNFLPESKRGLPTPLTAFYKMFGLSTLFPRSRTFSKYHCGYLDKDEVNEVDVLAGAFMLLRKTVLDEIGLLDEEFFMYGEDIDLSYRITQAGYKNYYFPETRIIHYKGESTKKSSVNYVFIFYNAMIIFAKKHFSKKNARIFSTLINFAIYLRAGFAILNRFFQKLLLPLIDFILFFAGLFLLKDYWETNVIYAEGGHYPDIYKYYVLPAYILVWIISTYFSGGYDKPLRLLKSIQGIIIGTVLILVAYALLDESFRFSRAIILLGSLWGMLSASIIRLVFHLVNPKSNPIRQLTNARFLIVGEKEESERVADLLKRTHAHPSFIGFVNPRKSKTNNDFYIGELAQIEDIIPIFKITEVIFCSKNITHREIIDKMGELQQFDVDYKIAPADSLSIIGSNSINTAGDLYIFDINSINKQSNRRNKNLLDFVVSILLLALYPVLFIFVKHRIQLLKNIIQVIFKRKSCVGYFHNENIVNEKLPKIREGILSPLDAFKNKKVSQESIEKLNLIYARDYKFWTDLNILARGWRKLGRKTFDSI